MTTTMNTYQAIITKYHGPTTTQPGRIIAKASAGRVTHHYDHGLSQELNHDAAARKLAARFGWGGQWHRGGMPDGSGNVYVCNSSKGAEFAFETAQGEG